jgi:hypothetical protein
MLRPMSRSSARCLSVALLLGCPLVAGSVLACSTDAEALTALAELRDGSNQLYRETAAIEANLEDALARRAREAGWDKTRTDAFRRRLVEDQEYLSLHRSREEGAALAAEGLAKLITAAATERPAVICAELPKVRFANQRFRVSLDLEYAWLNRKIWAN